MVNVINRYSLKYQNLGATRVVTQETASAYYSTNTQHSDEWYTPPNIISLVLQVLNEIDLDPCAEGNKNIPAHSYYTRIDDGLEHEWNGRLFLYPPSSHPDKWIAKLTAEVSSGRVSEAIALLPAQTDTDWLNSVLKTQPVCFWKERITFLDANSQPNLPATQSYCFVYWGNNQYRFKEVFEQHGIVYLPIWKSDEAEQSSNDEVLLVNSTSSTKRRSRGKGTGRIHFRTVTKRNGKQYDQPWYDWELNTGSKTISRSTYIPKHLFNIIMELEISKAPVNEILGMLGIIL
ncbi:MAG: phage N-6-adenine-methyltransferase [Calothrix sp. FI2-JRJ7]|jgi:phage N-6-adenine-methyltransferase|nr:phage N-6-adenine-methyltransferase [Calothrix sp. FI2-JRJ7]